MRWKMKAAIQNSIAMLPESLSYASYYRLQRTLGGLRRIDHLRTMAAAVKTCQLIAANGRTPVGGSFLEIGTGRVPLVPMAFWLMGAAATVTIDVNPYMRDELVVESLSGLRAREAEARALFGDLLVEERFDALLQLGAGRHAHASEVLKLCNIEYRAPCDASQTSLAAGRIDFHTSNNVLEHVPPAVLLRILQEGSRILAPQGLFVHRIDYSDHFSHSDGSISAINFLQYSDEAWNRYAGNRYMYMNRLRHDDMLEIFRAAGHRIEAIEPVLSEQVRNLVTGSGISLDPRFNGKTVDVLSTTSSWVVSSAER